MIALVAVAASGYPGKKRSQIHSIMRRGKRATIPIVRDTDAVQPLNPLRRRAHSNILFLWLTTVALLLSMLMLHSQEARNTMKNARILMVVTSAAKMPNGEPTGLWLEEFAVPYEVFKGAEAAITVASP